MVLGQRATTLLLSPFWPACYLDSTSGPKLPRKQTNRSPPERVHRKRHGCGVSVTTSHLPSKLRIWHAIVSLMCPRQPPALASARPQGQTLTGHRKHRRCPRRASLACPERGKECSCFPSPPGVSQSTTVPSASYGEGTDPWAKPGLQTPLICMCDKWKVREETN